MIKRYCICSKPLKQDIFTIDIISYNPKKERIRYKICKPCFMSIIKEIETKKTFLIKSSNPYENEQIAQKLLFDQLNISTKIEEKL